MNIIHNAITQKTTFNYLFFPYANAQVYILIYTPLNFFFFLLSKTLRAVFQITKNSLTKTFLKFVFLGELLLYSVALVSPIQQRELAISTYIYASPLSRTSLLPHPHCSPLRCHRVQSVELSPHRLSSLCYTSTSHQLSILHVVMHMLTVTFRLPSICLLQVSVKMYLISHLF